MKDSQLSNYTLVSLAKKPLGEILIEAGLVSIHQVELALQKQKDSNLRIGEILVLDGCIQQKTVDFFADKWLDVITEPEKKALVHYFKAAGLLNSEQIDAITRLQKLKYKKVRFHRLAVEQGYIKRMTVDFFLTYLFNIYNPSSVSIAKPYQVLKDYAQGQKDFQKVNLSKAPLTNVSLKGVTFDGANLRKSDLSKSNLSHSSLIGVNLKQANFTQAILTATNFTKSCLTQANFQSAHLEKANFKSAILHEVNFQSAYLAEANFAEADLTKAKLPLDYPYQVYYDRYTSFDRDFDPKLMGWKKT